MANNNLTVALKLIADGKGLDAGLRGGERSIHRFGDTAKREFHAIGAAWNSTMGKLGQIGLGVGLIAGLRDSARLDKGLTQTKQTASATKAEMAGLRAELFAMGKQTGANIEDLKSGSDALIASGQSWKAALEDMKGINVAMAVTGAEAKTLAGGLTVAGEAFDFDLEKPGLALQLLDKMTVAGRKGNAELENLADIFARVGVNAASAGLGFEKTLAFVETLSLVERQPERLATLADSTLRLFNNTNYMETAQEASNLMAMQLRNRKNGKLHIPDKKELKKMEKQGLLDADYGGVQFFDKKGGRRDPVEVLKDLRKQYQLMRTDQERSDFMGTVFDKMDLDTIKGLRTLLSGDALDKITGFEKEIKGGVGTLSRDLPEALKNAVDQAGRLKNTLREAADDFAKPINEALTKAIQYGLDNKKLSGKYIIEGGAIAAVGSYAAGRLVKGGLGKAFGALGGTAAGVGVGLALQQSAGVTPVFVVNMPGSGLPSGIPDVATTATAATAGAFMPKLFSNLRTSAAILGGSSLSELPMYGSGALATSAGLGLVSGGLGFGAGYGINKATQGTGFGHWLDDAVGNAVRPLADRYFQSGIAKAGRPEGASPDYSKMHGEIERAIDASKVGDIGRQINDAVTKVGEKKAILTLRILGTPAKVQAFESSGFNLNIDTGLLPVGQ